MPSGTAPRLAGMKNFYMYSPVVRQARISVRCGFTPSCQAIRARRASDNVLMRRMLADRGCEAIFSRDEARVQYGEVVRGSVTDTSRFAIRARDT